MMSSFSRWLGEADLGRYLWAKEQAFYDRSVRDAFGFRALQIGLPEFDLLRANRIPWSASAALYGEADIRCHPAQLPIAAGSIDLIVLPHVLDFTTHPHQVLREVERILVPDGRLVLTGFNPWSMWGAKRLLAGSLRVPWSGQFFSLPRIKDWLQLMGLEADAESGCFMGYAPPFARGEWLQRFSFLEGAGERWWPLTAGVYGIVAIKRVRGMRLITPKWTAAKQPAKGLVVAGGNDRHHAARNNQTERSDD